MQKCKLFFLFIFISTFVFGQSEIVESRGTIKIAKPNPDSIYIKAVLNFQQFQEGNKEVAQPNIIPISSVSAAYPKIHGYSIPFNYNQFCNNFIEIKKSDLSDKITDTVRIQVKILDNGKAYYKDMTPLMMLSGVPAYYNKKMNAYKLDAIHWKCMNIFTQIKQWEPSYMVIGVKGTFKKHTVIKPKKKKLFSIGILTIVFSTEPFED